MTISRLELMAVVIGVRCIDFVKSKLKILMDQVYFLSDSQSVLSWITTDKDLSVFVRNRVSEIEIHSHIKFDYIASKKNPEDIASRGCSLDSLAENQL